jgi:threonine/homoserine/homoserine lactone efflux protein
VSVDHVLAFALVAFALILVPGPSVLFIVGRALSLGRRSALETVAGNAAGEYAQVIAVAFGMGAIVERSVAVFTAVKLLGAAYWSCWASGPSARAGRWLPSWSGSGQREAAAASCARGSWWA